MDPFVEEPTELLGQTIQFRIRIHDTIFNTKVEKSSACRLSHTWCRSCPPPPPIPPPGTQHGAGAVCVVHHIPPPFLRSSGDRLVRGAKGRDAMEWLTTIGGGGAPPPPLDPPPQTQIS